MDVLHFVNVFSAGIAAGIQIAVLAAVLPALERLRPGPSLALHKAILDHGAHRFVLVSPPGIALVCALAIIVVEGDLTGDVQTWLWLGMLGVAGVAITTFGFNARINAELRDWPEEDVPAEYSQARRRWDRVHALRTTSGWLAFGCFVAAALAR